VKYTNVAQRILKIANRTYNGPASEFFLEIKRLADQYAERQTDDWSEHVHYFADGSELIWDKNLYGDGYSNVEATG